jgi:hypothetical protein
MPEVVEEVDYLDACESYLGWCKVCKAFTRYNTEPDAGDYDCEKCGNTDSVIGAEQALITEEIIF